MPVTLRRTTKATPAAAVSLLLSLGETQLTHDAEGHADASWSPDGELLAYTTGRDVLAADIAVMAATHDAPPTRVTTTPDRGDPVLRTTVTGGVYTVQQRGRALRLELAGLKGCPRKGEAAAA